GDHRKGRADLCTLALPPAPARAADFQLDTGIFPRLAAARRGAGGSGNRLHGHRSAPEVPWQVHPGAPARQCCPRPQLHVAVLRCSSPDQRRSAALIRYGPIGNTLQARRGDEMPLTPADVRNKQFSTTRLRPGYDEEEVDAFLDEVEVELDRLIQENEELRAKLAECMRGGGKTAASALNSPLTEHEPDLMAPEPMMPEPERRPEPAMMSMAPPPADNMDTPAP